MYSLEELDAIVKNCRACPLAQTRTNVVFGEGNKEANIMFIGEGPGYYEDRSGRPFVGKAGQLFDKILNAIDLEREDVYIANIVKCRPPNNRDPLESESNSCIEYLRWQVKIIDPNILVCLGRVAARNIIESNFRISKDRGKWIKKGKFYMIATYHPAALLRDARKKKDVWTDFKSIKAKSIELSSN